MISKQEDHLEPNPRNVTTVSFFNGRKTCNNFYRGVNHWACCAKLKAGAMVPILSADWAWARWVHQPLLMALVADWAWVRLVHQQYPMRMYNRTQKI
ncbi:hypothetical protein ACFX1X_007603 [Malus domestica]